MWILFSHLNWRVKEFLFDKLQDVEEKKKDARERKVEKGWERKDGMENDERKYRDRKCRKEESLDDEERRKKRWFRKERDVLSSFSFKNLQVIYCLQFRSGSSSWVSVLFSLRKLLFPKWSSFPVNTRSSQKKIRSKRGWIHEVQGENVCSKERERSLIQREERKKGWENCNLLPGLNLNRLKEYIHEMSLQLIRVYFWVRSWLSLPHFEPLYNIYTIYILDSRHFQVLKSYSFKIIWVRLLSLVSIFFTAYDPRSWDQTDRERERSTNNFVSFVSKSNAWKKSLHSMLKALLTSHK